MISVKRERLLVKGSPRWRGLRAGKPIIVNCHDHAEVGLCDDCLADFALVVADVPRLLDDLDVALAGEAVFVEHGARNGSLESKAGGGHPAYAAHSRLVRALGRAAGWFDARHPEQLARLLGASLDRLQGEADMPAIAQDVSSAASRAHRVIERPPDLMFYGPCPDCGRDIWQERIHRDDLDTKVECRFCDYEELPEDHIRRQLDDDRLMTVTELVSAITMAGEVVTRAQINNWIARRGLPREVVNRPVWVEGALRPKQEFVYRLGDVRNMALEAEMRRATRAVVA